MSVVTSSKTTILPADNESAKYSFRRIHRTSMVSIGEKFFYSFGPDKAILQDRYALLILREGSATSHVDGTDIRLHPGEMILVKPGQRDEMIYRHGFSQHLIVWCILRREILPASLLSRFAEFPIGVKAAGSDEFFSLLDLALSVQSINSNADALFYNHLALTIFFEFSRLVERRKSGEVSEIYPAALLHGMEVLESKIQVSRQSLEALAKEAGISANHLIKLFRKHLGTTPMQHLWKLRVQRGAELLRSTGLSVSEVAYHCGFSSPFHFSRAFKSVFDVSPKQFRTVVQVPETMSVSDDPAVRSDGFNLVEKSKTFSQRRAPILPVTPSKQTKKPGRQKKSAAKKSSTKHPGEKPASRHQSRSK